MKRRKNGNGWCSLVPVRPRPPGSRQVVLALVSARSRHRVRQIVHVVAFASASCSITAPEVEIQDELERAERRWQNSGVTDYRYVVQRSCFCDPKSVGPAEVVVKGDVVTVFDPATGEPYPEDHAALFPDVEGLFDIVREALADGADDIQVTYSSHWGHPTEIDIDYIRNAMDDELVVTASEVVPVP